MKKLIFIAIAMLFMTVEMNGQYYTNPSNYTQYQVNETSRTNQSSSGTVTRSGINYSTTYNYTRTGNTVTVTPSTSFGTERTRSDDYDYYGPQGYYMDNNNNNNRRTNRNINYNYNTNYNYNYNR